MFKTLTMQLIHEYVFFAKRIKHHKLNSALSLPIPVSSPSLLITIISLPILKNTFTYIYFLMENLWLRFIYIFSRKLYSIKHLILWFASCSFHNIHEDLPTSVRRDLRHSMQWRYHHAFSQTWVNELSFVLLNFADNASLCTRGKVCWRR